MVFSYGTLLEIVVVILGLLYVVLIAMEQRIGWIVGVIGSALFVACGRGQRLYRAEISGSSLVNVQQYFVGTFGRLRTVEPAPGGDLWLTTTNTGDKDSVPNNSNERIIRVDLR